MKTFASVLLFLTTLSLFFVTSCSEQANEIANSTKNDDSVLGKLESCTSLSASSDAFYLTIIGAFPGITYSCDETCSPCGTNYCHIKIKNSSGSLIFDANIGAGGAGGDGCKAFTMRLPIGYQLTSSNITVSGDFSGANVYTSTTLSWNQTYTVIMEEQTDLWHCTPPNGVIILATYPNVHTPYPYLTTLANPPGVGTINPPSGYYPLNSSLSLSGVVNNQKLDGYGDPIPYSGVNYSFAYWSGESSGILWLQPLTMNGNKSVTANYLPSLSISGVEFLAPGASSFYAVMGPIVGYTYKWYKRDRSTNYNFVYKSNGISRNETLGTAQTAFELRVEAYNSTNSLVQVGYKIVYGDFQ